MVQMGAGSLSDVMASLLLWIGSVTAYDLPAGQPSLGFLSEAEMRVIACNGEPCAAVAFYHFEEDKIYLREEMSGEMDLCAISVLLHELTHFVQHHDEKLRPFDSYSRRTRYALQEQEAYKIQLAYLRQYPYRYRPRVQSISYAYQEQAMRGEKTPRYYMAKGCHLNLD